MKEHEKREQLRLKFDFFVEHYTNGIDEIKNKIGIKSAGTLNSFRSPTSSSRISQPYMETIERHFDVPISIWQTNVPYDKNKLDEEIVRFRKDLEKQRKKEKVMLKLFEKHQNSTKNKKQSSIIENLFPKNQRVWSNLRGDFYAYMYGSHVFNGDREIKCIKTTFHDDFQVIDQHKNKGVVLLGDSQGIILKKTNAGHFSIIVFPTKQVTYGTFRFNIISIQNGTDHEMANWGFYSKMKLSIKEAKEILGKKDKVQLKLDLEFAKRVRQNFTIDYSEYD